MTKATKRFLLEPVTLDGVTKPCSEWCVERGIDPNRVYSRRQRAMTWAEAFSKKDMGKNFSDAFNRKQILMKERHVSRLKRGVEHSGSVLDAAAVRDIRASDESLSSLAKKYKVDRSTIHAVRKRRTWKDVPDDLTPSPDGR